MNNLLDLRKFTRFSKPFIPKKKKVCIGLCVHRDISPETHYSLSLALACPDPLVSIRAERGDALIARSRSILASKFLKEKIEDVLLFVDDDIIFQPEDLIKISKDIFEMKLDIVGGCYPTKSEIQCVLQQKLFKDQEITIKPDAVPVETNYVSTGFMVVSRQVFEVMAEDKEKFPLCYPQEFYPFFDTGHKIVDGKMRFLGEDWNFCESAREKGFKIWLDPSIRLMHVGRYVYTIDDLLRPPRKDGLNFRYKENFQE